MLIILGPAEAFMWTTLLGLLAYTGSRAAVGKFADKQIAAVLISVALVAPWWAALFGSAFGHVAGIALVKLWSKEKLSMRHRKVLALLPAIFVFTAFVRDSIILVGEVDAFQAAEKNAWTRFAKKSAAHSYVSGGYKQCVESRTPDLVCEAAILATARANYGEGFAVNVRNAVEEWKFTHTKLAVDTRQRYAGIVWW